MDRLLAGRRPVARPYVDPVPAGAVRGRVVQPGPRRTPELLGLLRRRDVRPAGLTLRPWPGRPCLAGRPGAPSADPRRGSPARAAPQPGPPPGRREGTPRIRR